MLKVSYEIVLELRNMSYQTLLTLKLPWVTKTEFLLTVSIWYQADKQWENKKKVN